MKRAMAATGALLIALTGCSGLPGGQQTGQGGDQGTRTQSPTSGPVESVPPLGDPIATREITSGASRYALDLYPLRRSGETVHLDARVRYLQISGSSDQALLADGGAFSRVEGRTNGFQLIDAQAAKIHLPARYGNDEAACSPRLQRNAKAGDEAYVTCVFGAVASDEVEVHAATFGSFAGVQIR